MGIYAKELFNAIALVHSESLKDFTAQQLSLIRNAFDTVDHTDDVDFTQNLRNALAGKDNRKPCKHWQNGMGMCAHGDKCMYAHVVKGNDDVVRFAKKMNNKTMMVNREQAREERQARE